MNWKKSVSQLLCSAKKPSDKFDNDAYHHTTIQDLPDDILMEIFSYLGVDYFRTTSLVCHRWNDLTFRSGNIRLNVIVLNRDRSMEISYSRLLSKSKRPYRHLKLVDCQHALISKVLTTCSSNLDSLMLSCDINLEYLANIVLLCPNIRKLDIKFSIIEQNTKKLVLLRPLVNLQHLKVNITFLNLPDINLCQLAPNVTSLTILYSEDLAVPEPLLEYYGPRLKELILLVDLCLKSETKIKTVWQTRFPLLQRFECHFGRHDGSDDLYDPIMDMEQVLEPCGQLKEAKFYRVTHLPRLTLKLSHLCTNLRELSLGMIRFTEQHLVHICLLQHLKYLHIEESFVETPNFQCYQILDSLTQLSLHDVSVITTTDFNHFVRHAFPALSNLQMHNCWDLFYVAEGKLFALLLLEQLSVRQRDPIDWEFLVRLSSLPLLKTVTLICPKFSEYSLDYEPEVVSSSVQTLSIRAELSDDDLLRMVRFFPNLRLLKLRQTNGYTQEGIRRVQMLVPECFVKLPLQC